MVLTTRPQGILLLIGVVLSLSSCALSPEAIEQQARRQELRDTLNRLFPSFPECAATAERHELLDGDCKLEVRAWMASAKPIADQLRTALPPKKRDEALDWFDQIAADVATFNWGAPKAGFPEEKAESESPDSQTVTRL